MDGLRGVFGKRTAFLAVVHAESIAQVLRNVGRALDCGADGVFLINHVISHDALVDCYAAARARWPDAWIGLSFLDERPAASLRRLPADASGLWVGDAEIHETDGPSADARAFANTRAESGWNGLYFGGVAFKHQRPVSDPALAAAMAAAHVDVVTTSGSATGHAAPLAKVASMKRALGDHPLALASGVSPENAADYAAHAQVVLVATGISDSEAELNPDRIAALRRALEAAAR